MIRVLSLTLPIHYNSHKKLRQMMNMMMMMYTGQNDMNTMYKLECVAIIGTEQQPSFPLDTRCQTFLDT